MKGESTVDLPSSVLPATDPSRGDTPAAAKSSFQPLRDSSEQSLAIQLREKLKESERQVTELRLKLNELHSSPNTESVAWQALEHTATTMSNVVEKAPVGLLRLTNEGMVISANTLCRQLLETPITVIINAPFTVFLTRDSQEEFSRAAAQVTSAGGIQQLVVMLKKSRHSQNHLLALLARGKSENNRDGLIVTLLDVSRQFHVEEKLRNAKHYLERIANQDTLTNLSNRSRFSTVLRNTMVQCRKTNSRLALMYFDIDGFKGINDTYGHQHGDTLLREIANRLRTRIRDCDRIARLGGDEFALVIEHVQSDDAALREAETIAAAIRAPVWLGNISVEVTSSIGVCIYPTDAASPSDLIKGADVAMYSAKQSGGNQAKLFSAELKAKLDRQHALESGVSHAIANREFSVHYQPIYDASEESVIAAEALLRWDHPNYGRVDPTEFIPIVEATGKIVELGWWVIEQSCSTLAKLSQSKETMRVCVNLSPIQLESEDFDSRLIEVMQRHGINPRQLTLEITESMFISETERAKMAIESMLKNGCTIAIDDFGTGYSSLARLSNLPSQIIKLDREFIANVANSDATRAVVKGIVSIAHELGQLVVAEGVENQNQASMLRECGCDYYQGFLFSHPLPESNFLSLV